MPPRCHIHACASLLPVILLLCTPVLLPSLRAQDLDTTGRLTILDPGFRSGFLNDDAIDQVFFRDSTTGFINGRYRTSDGGVTWTHDTAYTPVPHVLHADGFGVSVLGYTSLDSGRTWEKRAVPGNTSEFLGYGATVSFVAASPRVMAAVLMHYGHYELPLAGGKDLAATRLVLTTDGGTTWGRMDSVVPVELSAGEAMASVAAPNFVAFPRPVTMVDPYYQWLHVVDMPSETKLRVILAAHDRSPSGEGSLYYLGIIDLVTRQAEWFPLPYERGIDFHRVPVERVIMKAEQGLLYLFSLSRNANSEPSRLHVSDDGGRTWATIEHPLWVILSGARAFSRTLVVTPNARTDDGGVTWKPWSEPVVFRSLYTWYDAARSFAPISPDYYVVGHERTVGRTTDGGRTWTRNHAWDRPQAAIARGGTVIAGWAHRTVSSSIDSAITWRDAGATGAGMPEQVATVGPLAFMESGGSARNVVAIAQIGVTSSKEYIGCLRSTDAGNTWSEAGRIEQLDSLADNWPYSIRNANLRFYDAPDGDGRTGFLTLPGMILASEDDGATWQVRSLDTVRNMEMADAMHGLALALDMRTDQWHVLVTDDGWRTSDTLSAPFPQGHRLMELRAMDRDRYHVLFSHSAYQSTDGGRTWQQQYASGVMPRPMSGTVCRIDERRLYVLGGSYLFYYSDDEGRTYRTVRLAASNYHWLYDAAIASDGSYIYFMDNKNAVARWRIGGEPVSGVERAAEGREGEMDVGVLVASDHIHLRCTLPVPAHLRAELLDMRGVVVGRQDPGVLESGEVMVRFDTRGLPSGRYQAVITADGRTGAAAVFIVR